MVDDMGRFVWADAKLQLGTGSGSRSLTAALQGQSRPDKRRGGEGKRAHSTRLSPSLFPSVSSFLDKDKKERVWIALCSPARVSCKFFSHESGCRLGGPREQLDCSVAQGAVAVSPTGIRFRSALSIATSPSTTHKQARSQHSTMSVSQQASERTLIALIADEVSIAHSLPLQTIHFLLTVTGRTLQRASCSLVSAT